MKIKILLIGIFLGLICVHSDLAAQSLEQIKVAAEAGDAAAQDKLAEQYIMRTDSANAELWYRKAAAQGYAHAQGKLGNLLLLRARMSFNMKPADKETLAREAVQWATLAANQGDKRGQADLADVSLEGKIVPMNLIAAYKWGELAAQGVFYDTATITGRSARDSAILKMTAAQIEEARHQVAVFKPQVASQSDLPDPAWFHKIKLGGISGLPDHRLVVINGKTLAQNESATLKINGQNIFIRCLKITESSAVIAIDGISGSREIKMSTN